MIKLFNGQSSNGQSATVVSKGALLTFLGYGTWDGASLKVQCRAPGETWIDADSDNLVLTANGIVNLQVAAGVEIRLDLSGVGTSSIDADLVGMVG